MTLSVFIRGRTEEEKVWMKENYEKANELFLEIHKPFYDKGESVTHGMDYLKGTKSWSIYCHWNHEHAKETENDIKTIIKKLGGPDLEILIA